MRIPISLPVLLLSSTIHGAPTFNLNRYDLLLGLDTDRSSPLAENSQPALTFYEEVYQSITTLSAHVTALRQTLDTLNPNVVVGLSAAGAVQQETALISKDMLSITLSADSSNAWSSTESYNIAVATLALEPELHSLLNAFVVRKPSLTSESSIYGLGQFVRETLERQLQLTRDLGDVLATKLAPPFSSFVPLVVDQMEAHFDEAIADYALCQGLMCLARLSVEETKEIAFDRWQLDRVNVDGSIKNRHISRHVQL